MFAMSRRIVFLKETGNKVDVPRSWASEASVQSCNLASKTGASGARGWKTYAFGL
jgi:hypothetical protein